jgi:hypothetical protein
VTELFWKYPVIESAELPFSQFNKIPQGKVMQAQLKQVDVLSQSAVIEVVSSLGVDAVIINPLILQEPIKKMDDIELEQFIRGIAALCDCV